MSSLGDTQVRACPAEQMCMTTDERTEPDCGGYVGVDCTEGVAVSLTPYRAPAPRTPSEREAAAEDKAESDPSA
jgi:hypothetical protein